MHISVKWKTNEIENGNGDLSKQQQPVQRADNSQRPSMGLQCSKRIPQLEEGLSWPLNKNVY